MMRPAYQKTIERIVDTLEKGVAPWKRPWNTAINAISGKPYRGINMLVLATADYADPRYLTFLQAKDLHGYVRPGSAGFPVVKWHFPTTKELQKNPNAMPWVRGYTVFNVEQCDGVNLPELPTIDRNPIADAQAIIENWTDRPCIEHGGYQAAYNPILDRVLMPETEKFCSVAHYYDTLFHECVHSTGYFSRLNRSLSPRFNTDAYGLEELIAEIGGAMLNAEAGIDSSSLVENNAAYLSSWLTVLKGNPEMLIKAASMAAKAADMILGRCYAVEDESEERQPDEILVAAA